MPTLAPLIGEQAPKSDSGRGWSGDFFYERRAAAKHRARQCADNCLSDRRRGGHVLRKLYA